ncbi:methyltransferase [Salipiger marinus]|jgi:predicted TPR repeat methyltransferase|uniref:class I SAM-dependent DNA methyltransferase n=1 Tax=Salipiger marinus TaxID=555512 RepID=UPI000E810939|nr:methyltransferase domain-containing protein [Salipiger manganoxidans]MCD1618234.1 methyltransferase domain-containing protein [Salipiger manganoxidans]MEB3418169.1 methyltransferase domain-containing protein [Salipiger manganoxidans]HBM59344.1 methyltransferase type 12 [Citreicella sp.]HBT00773.1 methyltransferase type 12 [Citreicella sp.]
MVGTPFPSGQPDADRRASFAETLVHLGDLAGALEVLSGALDLAPGWAAGWFRLGELHEMAGDRVAAMAALDRAVTADPRDPLGAGLKRDLLSGQAVSETMPPAFVELLFDQYAPRFEASLVDRLGYCGPAWILHELDRTGFGRAARALDLGCGTGLAGEVLRPRCDWLEGYDLSGGMLAEAQAKGLYDQLEKRDIATLDLGPARYDLIVAADVFIYLGALERIIGWCAGSLAPGGRLAFTVELGEAPVTLRESRRFAHSRSYVAGLMQDAGFGAVQLAEGVLRQDRGAGIVALCVVAGHSAFSYDREGDGETEALA